ncbi:uncharacterized protein CLUP02_08926 [Colletotrichum lupini]|uniref:Uncharacterized protein n=1 Tax=Colletotrichum lupini TaxID=145971 RepID=A0A9Q8STW9_9PEZI|nr:uncharacterized protein CLUP02_08926 [Colletotrichum lupini]UQC83431.1 hypothetical protein CLUP02_08926 [Colletotrichum lupini]
MTGMRKAAGGIPKKTTFEKLGASHVCLASALSSWSNHGENHVARLKPSPGVFPGLKKIGSSDFPRPMRELALKWTKEISDRETVGSGSPDFGEPLQGILGNEITRLCFFLPFLEAGWMPQIEPNFHNPKERPNMTESCRVCDPRSEGRPADSLQIDRIAIAYAIDATAIEDVMEIFDHRLATVPLTGETVMVRLNSREVAWRSKVNVIALPDLRTAGKLKPKEMCQDPEKPNVWVNRSFWNLPRSTRRIRSKQQIGGTDVDLGTPRFKESGGRNVGSGKRSRIVFRRTIYLRTGMAVRVAESLDCCRFLPSARKIHLCPVWKPSVPRKGGKPQLGAGSPSRTADAILEKRPKMALAVTRSRSVGRLQNTLITLAHGDIRLIPSLSATQLNRSNDVGDGNRSATLRNSAAKFGQEFSLRRTIWLSRYGYICDVLGPLHLSFSMFHHSNVRLADVIVEREVSTKRSSLTVCSYSRGKTGPPSQVISSGGGIQCPIDTLVGDAVCGLDTKSAGSSGDALREGHCLSPGGKTGRGQVIQPQASAASRSSISQRHFALVARPFTDCDRFPALL